MAEDLKLNSVTSNDGNPDEYKVDLTAIRSNQFSIDEIAHELTSDQKHIVLKRLDFDSLVTLKDLPPQASFILEKVETITEEKAMEVLKDALKTHYNDPNFPLESYNLIEKLVEHKEAVLSTGIGPPEDTKAFNEKEAVSENYAEVDSTGSSDKEAFHSNYFKEVFDWSLQVRLEAALNLYWSPYPEVRSATDPFDDPTELCESWRVYLVGLIWVGISSFVNQYFAQRLPSVTLPASCSQVLLYPCGLILGYLPKWKLKLWKGYTFQLNPGPWTTKEQMLATMMVSITSTPYIEGPLYVQKMSAFYGFNWVTWGYEILLGISTQFVGFGLAGLVRKFCIYPSKSVWPTILPTVVTNRALLLPEKRENINGWKISRYRYFFLIFAASFLYYWFPDYIFQALSTFNWMTWIKPDNLNLANITGSASGLGFNPIPTFDWNVISVYSMPLVVPALNTFNSFIGALIAFFSIVGVFYTNKYWTGFLPINSSSIYTNTGEPYEVQAVLNEHNKLDHTKYEKYGPPFYTAANLVVYGAFFASYPFTIFYVSMTNYGDIIYAFKSLWLSLKDFHRSSLEGFEDAQSRMMSRYREVPEWVFLIILVIAIVLGIVCVEIYPTETPVWGIFFTVGINFLFLVPFTVLYSMTGFQLSMNVLVELIVGYALPGNPNAHLILKSFGTQTDIQAQDYIANQKIAHYAKIPPWSAFRVQILATFVNLFICLAVINWQADSFEGLCQPNQPQKFTCAGDAEIYYSASVIWGVIGPKRVFDHLYPLLRWCFLIGFLMVFPCYAIFRALPLRYRKWWQPTIIIGAFLNYFAPYNLSYITVGFYLSMLFMVYIKNNYLAWWEKYTYLTSSGLTSGLALSAIIIFFAVNYHDKPINWWGNTVSYAGFDGDPIGNLNATLQAPDGYFGPRVGHFP